MEATAFSGTGYVLQPRINLRRSLPAHDAPVVDSSKLAARQEDCTSSSTVNQCERPVGTDPTRMAIILGIAIPVVALAIAIFFLHRRNVRRQRAEDAKDSTGLDYGMGSDPVGKKTKRKSILGFGEKQVHRPGQLSMDMNLSSPYLLPPGAHQSQDSIHTLVRTFPNEHDPYRLVTQYTGSETGSIRSYQPSRDTVGYNSKRASVLTGKSVGTVKMPPSRMNSLPKSPTSPDATTPFNPSSPDVPRPARKPLTPQGEDIEMDLAETRKAPYPSDGLHSDELHMPEVQPPSATLAKDPFNRQQSPPLAHQPQMGHLSGDVGLNFDFSQPVLQVASPVLGQSDLHNKPEPASQPQIRTSVYYEDHQLHDEEDRRGRAVERPHPGADDHGLTIPHQDNKRLSVGFRPLPPDEVTESEDPEYRANRIRSFYKEYFDESRDAGPMPSVPRGRPGPQYYEDYDAGYLGDATYYDANSNAFVMPYAQPVTRRAMTPPPAGRMVGSSGPRPRGPFNPHGPSGSIGGMSVPGGPRRPRAGSAFGPRGPGSPASLGPRPDSSASGTMSRRQPKKQLPPPAALTTLPTPSKLKDDSFAILNAIDFAPPDNFRDQAAGRSQSPLGERRAYSPQVPVSSPLVTAFDELGALPSPHVLRKSSTFTALDFAPPKKFKDADTMSDAGSIRSNRSGISAVQLTALRGGAGRVSRLPGDTVFTQASLENQLKPQWGMRP
ncbi:hypothetical protein S40288_02077 [Stachybotrys chartarum IBT 40288]|nr:hypothetical protein S40288_02077 [Stachybotrys chartarum IBT 40288]